MESVELSRLDRLEAEVGSVVRELDRVQQLLAEAESRAARAVEREEWERQRMAEGGWAAVVRWCEPAWKDLLSLLMAVGLVGGAVAFALVLARR